MSSWQNPPKNLFWSNCHLGDKCKEHRPPFSAQNLFCINSHLPQNLYYGWRPQRKCCWGKTLQCSNAQSLRIYWADEGEGARGHQSQRGAIPTSHNSNRFYSMNVWTRRTRSEAIASKHPWPKRTVSYSIEILSMTRFIEVMCDWQVDSSSSYFFVTTRWHVCSCQLSKRTGLISIVHYIIFRSWPACCNCW